MGPTLVALHQSKPLTVGLLTNQVWSYAGDGDRPDYVVQTSASPSWQLRFLLTLILPKA